MAYAGAAHAAAGSVATIAGGRLTVDGPDAGFVDGDALQMSQFHTPFDCALDGAGHLWVADRGNGALRKIDLQANRCSTALQNLNDPVAVAVDSANNVFVLTHGDGAVLKLDNLGVLSTVAVGFFRPTAIAIDSKGVLYIAQENGQVTAFDPASSSRSSIASGLGSPAGIAVTQAGWLAVSDAGRNVVYFMDPSSGAILLQAGAGVAGFQDGAAASARFSQPQKVASSPDGSVVVADRMNHRVRRIGPDGNVTTLFGVDPSQWEGPACPDCNPAILPGWLDGSVEFAEAREPVGVTVGADGTLYDTEVFYHIIRKATGLPLTAGATSIVVLPPQISPSSGYFPMGADITVTDPNSNPLLRSAVFYTTDGTEPTPASLRAPMRGGTGTIHWQNSLQDLRALRVKTFIGAASSVTVSGVASPDNAIGFSANMAEGIGSTLVAPVVLNLQSNVVLRSLAFVVEITPDSPGAPPISDQFRALLIDPAHDFIPVVAPNESGQSASFTAIQSALGTTQRLGIAYVSTNAHFQAQDFAVAAQLAIPIPRKASEGMQYRLEVVNATATTDKNQALTLDLMPPRELTVHNNLYLVGDTASAGWYSAGLFGDGDLTVQDANQAFDASLGFHVPFLFTDAFDAMDAYPEDSPGVAGGDGQIRFLDWQVILLRALRFDLSNWTRHRISGGGRTADPVTLPVSVPSSADSPASALAATNAPAWFRNAAFGCESIGSAAAGAFVSAPVYVRVAPGDSLSGLQFRIAVQGPDALPTPPRFVPARGFPDLIAPPSGLPAGEVGGAWNLGTFDPPLEGSNTLGQVIFQLPFEAEIGSFYSLRFLDADGSPEPPASYQFETVTGKVWVGAPIPAAEQPPIISDDWKVYFFGSADNPLAAPAADPNGNGVPNWQEYLAGTDPTSSSARLFWLAPQSNRTPAGIGLTLRWMSLSGRNYQIDQTDSLAPPAWTSVATVSGNGQLQQYPISAAAGRARFYRIALLPP